MATILIVDDCTDHREFLSILMARRGFDCLSAGNGIEALRLLEQTAVDLVLTDVFMPEMDGIEFLRSLRRVTARDGIPVIAMTGGHDGVAGPYGAVMEAMGADDVVYKPLDQAKLFQAIETRLGGRVA
jgi:CheY-like chemotaxis protein